jgi:hypothetical protein
MLPAWSLRVLFRPQAGGLGHAESSWTHAIRAIPMRFKNPVGNLTWMSPLMVIGGTYMAVMYSLDGAPGLAALYAVVAFCALLVWFDLRWVSAPLMLFFAFVLVAGVLALTTKEFSWRRVLRMVLPAYMLYELWEWGWKRRDADS